MAKVHAQDHSNDRSRHLLKSSFIPKAVIRPAQAPGLPREAQNFVGSRAKKKLRRVQIFNMIRRILVLCAAIRYTVVSLTATVYTFKALHGSHTPEMFRVLTASLIGGYVGDGLIRESPLVQNVLKGDTTPRHAALFLETKEKTSFQSCSKLPTFNSKIYNFDFLSYVYRAMVASTRYNLTTLDDFELVLVIIDCSFSNIKSRDSSTVRFFNLIRSRIDPDDLHILTMSLSVQEYEIPDQRKKGPGLLTMITVSKNMSADVSEHYYLMALTYPFKRAIEFEVYEFVGINIDSYLELRSIPSDPLTQPVKHLITSRNRGFYDGIEQSNIRHMYFLFESNAKKALTRWEWFGEAIILGSWAWVHGFHMIFAIQMICSLIVLCLMTYQNARAGKFWLGDPFASISTTTLFMRGVFYVISWLFNNFWMLYTVTMARAGQISHRDIIQVYEELVYADVLVVCLGLIGVFSSVFRERIDPSIVIFLFEITYRNQMTLLTSVAIIRNEIVSYSERVLRLKIANVTSAIAAMSPLRLKTAIQIPHKGDGPFIAAFFFPIALLLALIVGYVILRKVYRRFFPEKTRTRSSVMSDERSSANEKTALLLSADATNFEKSTGARMQTRFGLISDYNNYVYFKGMKFASADGIYCSGYVIVGGKMLVSINDLLSIALIKATGYRFTNVYAYEVEGNSVKDRARLIYPDTLLWSELWRLNVTVLL